MFFGKSSQCLERPQPETRGVLVRVLCFQDCGGHSSSSQKIVYPVKVNSSVVKVISNIIMLFHPSTNSLRFGG